MPRVLCLKCLNPEWDEFLPGNLASSTYKAGDICAIKEGTHVPIYLLLAPGRRVPVQLLNPDDYRPRPCIVLNNPTEKGKPDSRRTRICLMATFNGGTRLEDLPEVLRLNCMPVSPHYLCQSGMRHIHTSPEWSKENAWLILHAYNTTKPISGRWRNMASQTPNQSFYQLDTETLSAVTSLSEARRAQWEEYCIHDKGMRRRCYAEYQAVRHKLYLARQQSVPTTTSDTFSSATIASTSRTGVTGQPLTMPPLAPAANNAAIGADTDQQPRRSFASVARSSTSIPASETTIQSIPRSHITAASNSAPVPGTTLEPTPRSTSANASNAPSYANVVKGNRAAAAPTPSVTPARPGWFSGMRGAISDALSQSPVRRGNNRSPSAEQAGGSR